MRTSNLETISAHFDALEIQNVPSVVVHSRLASFGRASFSAIELAKLLRSKLSADAALACPTYTMHIRETDVFDPINSPSQDVGILSEAIRSIATCRTFSPIHSHAIVQENRDFYISEPFYKESRIIYDIGPGSDFERFENDDYWLLLLGCEPDEGATYLHHVEALCEVPYREWLYLRRRVVIDQNCVDVVVKYFGRVAGAPQTDFSNSWIRFVRSGFEVRSVRLQDSVRRSWLIRLKDIKEFYLEVLRNDPFALTEYAGTG